MSRRGGREATTTLRGRLATLPEDGGPGFLQVMARALGSLPRALRGGRGPSPDSRSYGARGRCIHRRGPCCSPHGPRLPRLRGRRRGRRAGHQPQRSLRRWTRRSGLRRRRVRARRLLLFARSSVTEPTTARRRVQPGPLGAARGSVDGRYIDVDRPAVEGRVPSEDRRSSSARLPERARADLRDAPWGRRPSRPRVLLDGPLRRELDPGRVVAPIGVEALRISGFGVLPTRSCPTSSSRASSSSSAQTSPPATTASDLTSDMTFEQTFELAFPEDCSSQYDYYSLHPEWRSRATVGPGPVRRRRRRPEPPAPARASGAGRLLLLHLAGSLGPGCRRAEIARPTVTALLAFSWSRRSPP